MTFDFDIDVEQSQDSWLVMDPRRGVIAPGQTWHVTLKAYVSRKMAASLIAKSNVISHVLALQLQDGEDLFIPVHGTYAPRDSSVASFVYF